MAEYTPQAQVRVDNFMSALDEYIDARIRYASSDSEWATHPSSDDIREAILALVESAR